jgi:hypothetical protein
VQASHYLKQHPLSISDVDAQSINASVKSRLVESLMYKYDSDVSFTAIPSRWQTVIASVEFQYGSLQKNVPHFGLMILSKIGMRLLQN